MEIRTENPDQMDREKRLVETAYQSGNFSEIAYEFAPVGLVLTENRVIRDCNHSFSTMFGYGTLTIETAGEKGLVSHKQSKGQRSGHGHHARDGDGIYEALPPDLTANSRRLPG